MRHRGRLGGRRRSGKHICHELLQGPARRRPLHRRRRNRPGRRAQMRRQHLGGLPVLRRSGLALQDADRRCAEALASARRPGVRQHRVGPSADRRARADRGRKRVPGQEARGSSRPPALPGSRRSPSTGKIAATSRKRSETHGRKPRTSRRQLPGISARGSAQDGTASFASIEQLANAKIRLRVGARRSRQQRDRSGAKGHKGCDEAARHADRARDRPSSGKASMVPDTSDWPCSKRRPLVSPTIRTQRRRPRPTEAGRNRRRCGRTTRPRRRSPANHPSAPAQPLFYPAMNRIAAQLALADDAKRSAAMDDDTITSGAQLDARPFRRISGPSSGRPNWTCTCRSRRARSRAMRTA